MRKLLKAAGAAAGVVAALALLVGWWLPGDPAPLTASAASPASTAEGRKPVVAAQAPEVRLGDTRPGLDAFLNPSLILVFERTLAEAQATSKSAFMAVAPGLLAQRLPQELVARAMGLLERYVDMQEAMQRIAPPAAGDPESLRRTLEARAEARRTYFTPEEIEGLFDEEIRQDAFMVEKMALAQDASLSDDARQSAIQRREAAWLTPEQRSQRHAAQAHVDVQRQTAAMDARGASAQERFAERSASHGYEAARQLAALDQENHDWNTRLDQYAKAPPAHQDQLRELLFDAQERLRLDGALALRAARPPPAVAPAASARNP